MSSLGWLKKKLQAPKGLKKVVRTLVWLLYKEEVTDIYARLRALRDNLTLALSSDHVFVYFMIIGCS